MKKLLLTMCVCMAVVMVVAPAYAEELWDWHLRGVDEGLAAGALPPQGFYFVNDSYFAPSFKVHADNGSTISTEKLAGYVDVPILLWATGLKFLCADYAVAVAQPFDYTNLRTPEPGRRDRRSRPQSVQWRRSVGRIQHYYCSDHFVVETSL